MAGRFPNKRKIKPLIKALKEAGLNGLTIREAAHTTGYHALTVSNYFHYLEARKEIICIAKGNSKNYFLPKAALKDLERWINEQD